jgi:hypothetical protein
MALFAQLADLATHQLDLADLVDGGHGGWAISGMSP